MKTLLAAFSPEVASAIEELIEERVRAELRSTASDPARRDWLTYTEAGERLGCSPDAVRMQVKRGRLTSRRIGRRVYVSAASVEGLD